MDTPDGAVGSMPERQRRATRIAARRREVSGLLLLHWPYVDIARKLSVSVGTVASDVAAIRAEWREATLDDFQAHVDEHLAVLRELEAVVLTEALTLSDNGRVRLWAVDRAVQIRDRIAQLMGLNAPAKIEATLRVEMVVQALTATLAELGVDDEQARPVLARNLRALEAAS